MKNKLSILFLCVLGALVVLLGVITYINFHSGEKYKKQVLSQESYHTIQARQYLRPEWKPSGNQQQGIQCNSGLQDHKLRDRLYRAHDPGTGKYFWSGRDRCPKGADR